MRIAESQKCTRTISVSQDSEEWFELGNSMDDVCLLIMSHIWADEGKVENGDKIVTEKDIETKEEHENIL